MRLPSSQPLDNMPSTFTTINPLPESLDPKQESVFDPLYTTLLRKAVGVLGLDRPETAIESMISPLMSFNPFRKPRIFQVGNRMMTEVNGVMKLLDDTESTVLKNKLKNKLKAYDPPQVVQEITQLAEAVPPVRKTTPPSLSGKWSGTTSKIGSISRSKLSTGMIVDIRKRAAGGESINSIAKEYKLRYHQVREIVDRNSWAWVK